MHITDSRIGEDRPENTPTQVTLSGEIISRSQIGRGFLWPKNDPRLEWQPVRTYEVKDWERVTRLGVSAHFCMDGFLDKDEAFGRTSANWGAHKS